jgi:hypothetical protein
MKVLILFWVFSESPCWSQGTVTMAQISDLQIRNDSFYDAGLFPSERLRGRAKKARQDNNIFFTALTVFTLQSIRKGLTPSDRIILDTIASRAKRCYTKYRNRNGDITFNFWQTKPDVPFPNTRILSRLDKMRLPDDLDDTAIIYLTQPDDDTRDKELKTKMEAHAAKGRVRTTLKKYQRSQVYGTWFGKRMPQEIDICVMANAMVFVLERKLPLDSIDFKTLSLIEKMVMESDHLKYPHIVSPQYKNSSIILYHVARLLEVAGSKLSPSLREKVISDLKASVVQSSNEMEKVVLLTSLYRLGVSIENNADQSRAKVDFRTFYWFRANLMSGKPVFIKRMIGRGNWLDYKFRSEAYYLSLLMEFQFYRSSVNG